MRNRKNPQPASHTIVHAAPLDFQDARVKGLRPLPFEQGLFEGNGTIVSPVLHAVAPFNDLVGSWNAQLPSGASLRLEVQVLCGKTWSAWYGLGCWDSRGGSSLGLQEDAHGRVDIDTLKLKRPAAALRYRVTLLGKARPPKLLRVALSCLDTTRTPDILGTKFQPGPWVRELRLKPRSQMQEMERYKRDICSPTSLAMVLDFWGKHQSTLRVARSVKDRAADIFGNWTLNVAAAALSGLSGQVERLSGFDALQDLVAQGRPVIVSISFDRRGLSGSPLRKTRGHLLVIAGFTRTGDVIAYDPAAPGRKSVRRVYRRHEFARAWLLRKRGLAYVLGPRFPEVMRAGAPVADLLHRPLDPKTQDPLHPSRLSQLVYNEKVQALKAKGDWVKISALEQDDYLSHRRWHGYQGWVQADRLTLARPGAEPNAVVRVKRAASREGPVFSMGTRLRIERESSGDCSVRLLDGNLVKIPSRHLRRTLPHRAPSPKAILRAAAQFLGDVYVWGGRSGIHIKPSWGVDCSGLVNLSYRAEGMSLPRNAYEQFLKARRLQASKLRPGDLVFLTRPGTAKRINHVMLYEGKDSILESRPDRVLRTTFQERFGKPLSALRYGETVEDLSSTKPSSRRIFFGTYLHT